MKELNFSMVREYMLPGFDGVLRKTNPKMSFNGKSTAFLCVFSIKIYLRN